MMSVYIYIYIYIYMEEAYVRVYGYQQSVLIRRLVGGTRRPGGGDRAA